MESLIKNLKTSLQSAWKLLFNAVLISKMIKCGIRLVYACMVILIEIIYSLIILFLSLQLQGVLIQLYGAWNQVSPLLPLVLRPRLQSPARMQSSGERSAAVEARWQSLILVVENTQWPLNKLRQLSRELQGVSPHEKQHQLEPLEKRYDQSPWNTH